MNKEKITFETDDPQICQQLKKGRAEGIPLKDIMMSMLKRKASENMEHGVEQTLQIREPLSQEPSETQTLQCGYASLVVKENKNGLEYLAYCDNPKKTNLPRDREVPILACQKCWERQSIDTPDLKKVLQISNGCCNVVPLISEPEEIKRIPCIKNNGCPFPEDETAKGCLLQSEEMRKLIVQKFC